ncbi:allergen Tha p 1 [Galleria mellonella]|uniref:Allergen Tha p 1 n=2 Tax=Galleria mellonella TaxID=7137 RepID=A0A6J3C1J2_GALME|nr:allergen Tha p 1 [Galleria mellonella]XP_031765675.2 allergen Tha p 1 [Galleria mellonella]
MKIFLLSFILLYLTKGHFSEESKYTNKYDGVNLDEILTNERLLTGYIKCLLEQGPCTPDAKELKNNLPDAIQNDCKKCTNRQQQGADQVMGYIIDHRPDDWNKLEEKYKSDGSYKRKYLEKKQSVKNINSNENDVENKNGNSNEKEE